MAELKLFLNCAGLLVSTHVPDSFLRSAKLVMYGYKSYPEATSLGLAHLILSCCFFNLSALEEVGPSRHPY